VRYMNARWLLGGSERGGANRKRTKQRILDGDIENDFRANSRSRDSLLQSKTNELEEKTYQD
jgi:hypothetical protein